MKRDENLLSNDSSDFHDPLWAFSLKLLQGVLNSLNRLRHTTAGVLGCLQYRQAEIVHICPNPGNKLTRTLPWTVKTRADVALIGTIDFSWGNCSEEWNCFPQNHSEKQR